MGERTDSERRAWVDTKHIYEFLEAKIELALLRREMALSKWDRFHGKTLRQTTDAEEEPE